MLDAFMSQHGKPSDRTVRQRVGGAIIASELAAASLICEPVLASSRGPKERPTAYRSIHTRWIRGHAVDGRPSSGVVRYL